MLAMAGVQAASVDWKVSGSSAEKGYTAYAILGAVAETSWESVDAVATAAISSAVFSGSRTISAGATAASPDLTKDNANMYFVIVSADGTKWAATAVKNMASMVYDPANQETSAGTGSFVGTNLSYSEFGGGSGGDVPEPTSGLLLLVGGAMLALRRKQK